MARLTLRFAGDLTSFLAHAQRHGAFSLTVEGTPSIKDVIESVGVPHTEADVIIVGGVSVPFSYLVRDGDTIEVYPLFSELPPSTYSTPIYHLQPPNPIVARFVLDVHLGRLAAYLRMLGFDTIYANHCDDDVLAEISSREQRILLTRDVGLLKRSIVSYGYFVRQTNPEQQLEEVVRRYDLTAAFAPFKRCIRCNGFLESVEKAAIAGAVPENVLESYDAFQRCQQCRQIYWKGTHFQHMQSLADRMLQQAAVTAHRGLEDH